MAIPSMTKRYSSLESYAIVYFIQLLCSSGGRRVYSLQCCCRGTSRRVHSLGQTNSTRKQTWSTYISQQYISAHCTTGLGVLLRTLVSFQR